MEISTHQNSEKLAKVFRGKMRAIFDVGYLTKNLLNCHIMGLLLAKIAKNLPF